MFKLLALLAVLNAACANTITEVRRPNVIIMHTKNLLWSDLGIHVNHKDSENSTPNIDYLAYSGTILNRFYANGGIDSLLSGCYQRSQYKSTSLMTLYFQRNGYIANFIARNSFDKIEAFEQGVLDAITNDNEPFLTVADFGHLDEDIKIPFIDEIVASAVSKAHQLDVLNNTIILFLSLPDDSESPLEANVRRTAFIYSPLLKLQPRVSNQIVHVIDLLPTLVNAANIKWRTRDRIFIDGINQWPALNANDEERLSVFGDNFLITNNWKLTYGIGGLYGSIDNENMESDKDMTAFDFDSYVQTLFASELHAFLDKLTAQRIMYSKSRSSVHCNLKDIDESAVESIMCSRASPCLFDLMEDPCEFDNKHEPEFDLRRSAMQATFEKYLTGGIMMMEIPNGREVPVEKAEAGMDDGTRVGIILGGTIAACIIAFVVVVCVKEKCNRRRSVYYDKSKKSKKDVTESSTNGAQNGNANGSANGISVISQHVK